MTTIKSIAEPTKAEDCVTLNYTRQQAMFNKKEELKSFLYALGIKSAKPHFITLTFVGTGMLLNPGMNVLINGVDNTIKG